MKPRSGASIYFKRLTMTEPLAPQTADIVVALDIGTTKICCLAGRKNSYGQLEIIGVGKIESTGVSRGVVTNIEKTVTAIRESVAACERQARVKISTVHVGIAGQHIKSVQHRGLLTRDNDHLEIARTDIDRLINDMFKLVLPAGDRIIHVIPQEFTVDNEQGIVDPIGMCGVRLEANFHIITGMDTALKNIERCVRNAGLTLADITLEPIASAFAVLSEEEKEAGVALVDIGGGTTDVTVFQDGIIRHTAVIPLGGNSLTQDVEVGCRVMERQAESLKVQYGSALADEVSMNRIITIPGIRGREHKEISERNLALIIQARVEEILDYVTYELRKSGFDNKLIGGLVITGGGALLRDIEKLAEYHTGLICRIGLPIEHLNQGYQERVGSPIFSTGIGLLLKAFQDIEAGRLKVPMAAPAPVVAVVTEKAPEPNAEELQGNGGWFENIFHKTKQWFEAEPDMDFDNHGKKN
jgi:cell division protein FtsA